MNNEQIIFNFQLFKIMREYFGIVYRKIQKNKLETINKIAGLTVSVVVCLLIAFYVYDEFSYDRFHSKKDRVYRLINNDRPVWPKVMFQYLKEQIPGVEEIANFTNSDWRNVLTINNISFQEKGFYIADPEILNILEFHITASQSRKEELLTVPNTMLISQKMAEKFFPDESPLGKTIKYDNELDMTITGVFENFPDQSHVNPQFLISSAASALNENKEESWHEAGSNAYVLLSPNVLPEEAAERIKDVVCHVGQGVEEIYGKAKFSLQPLTAIHLHSSGFNWDVTKKGDIDFVRMIMMTGILILLIACTNHINLTITQTMTETKKFAIMKTMGGLPRQIRQYIYAEILFNVVISVIIAVLVTMLLLPVFGNIVEKQFVLDIETLLYTICMLVTIVITVTSITAAYPAFHFSRIPVMHIFQKSYKMGSENVRKGLIVFQFTVSIILISSTIFMNRQRHLLTSEKLGFDREQLLVINNPGGSEEYERFKTIVDKIPAIESISFANNAPAGNINNSTVFRKLSATDDDYHGCTVVFSAIGFLPTLQACFLSGTDFTESGIGNQIILSRKLVEELGETPENVIGMEYKIGFSNTAQRVVGVVEDIQYHPHRKKDARSGTLFWYVPRFPQSIVVRTAKGDWRHTVAQLETAWQEAAPAWPFVYEMMDERLVKNYRKELADIRTISAFSVVAIILSCFGVMGISRYTARKRTKEIAIRKVCGADKRDIMLLLNSNFMVLNLIAFVAAIPVVILFISKWLQNFSFKTDLSWWVFVLAGLTTTVVVIATVSWQSWRAANANPVDAIKSE